MNKRKVIKKWSSQKAEAWGYGPIKVQHLGAERWRANSDAVCVSCSKWIRRGTAFRTGPIPWFSHGHPQGDRRAPQCEECYQWERKKWLRSVGCGGQGGMGFAPKKVQYESDR